MKKKVEYIKIETILRNKNKQPYKTMTIAKAELDNWKSKGWKEVKDG